MASAESPDQVVTANVRTIDALLGWALKLAPVIGSAILFFFTLYSNQASLLKHGTQIDARLAEMDRLRNLDQREMVERLAKSDAAVEILKHELEFYLSTNQRRQP